jgi:3-dehydroquinate synthase
MLDVLENETKRLLAVDIDLTTEMVARNGALKAAVVSEDEHESGRRMQLNYGHTIGHALEAVTGYAELLHGEAISAGMMAAAEIGRRIGVTPASVGERQRALFDAYGLPVRHAGVDVDAVIEALSHDKKVVAGKVRWVLLEDFGRVVIRDDVPPDVVRAVVTDLLSSG